MRFVQHRIAEYSGAWRNGHRRSATEGEGAVRTEDQVRAAGPHADMRCADLSRGRAIDIRQAHADGCAADGGVDNLPERLIVEDQSSRIHLCGVGQLWSRSRRPGGNPALRTGKGNGGT